MEVIGEGDFVSEWIGFKEVQDNETQADGTQSDETQPDDTQNENFCHTFVAVDWEVHVPKKKTPSKKRKTDEVVKLPNIPIPNNPNLLDQRLYNLKYVTPLIDFIAH